ncbi:patatin-like phospholipase family protein [Candidatus Odyssella acanthamoebae]|uniref:patatin-like phospholipase family protein n=1 Tax=Candidatus Odyssella acanthamoebae TaxID=91604 RepID=UPI000692328A|nr:patatin-like phospholipase family protein [Candidatus Paracaedibacter acanthamoebae]
MLIHFNLDETYKRISKWYPILMTLIALSSSWAMEQEGKTEMLPSSSLAHSPSERQVVRILTIDGGGVRGVLPATILEGVEERLEAKLKEKVQLADCFDIMAGTSTGGIIVLGLNAGKSAEDLVKFYRDYGQTIFPPVSTWGKITSWAGPKYDAHPLEKILAEQLGDKWLSDSIGDVLIPADNMGEQCAYIFNSSRAKKLKSQNFRMKDVGRATSAAPTFFEAATIQDQKGEEHTFLDGGLYANDPTYEAIRRAEKKFPGCDLFIVSLGTGEPPRKFGDLSLKSGGKVAWAPKIADHLMGRHQDRHLKVLEGLKESLENQGRNVEYYRIQLPIEEVISDMDKAANIENLRQAGLFLLNPENPMGYYKTLKQIVSRLQDYKEKQLV